MLAENGRQLQKLHVRRHGIVTILIALTYGTNSAAASPSGMSCSLKLPLESMSCTARTQESYSYLSSC